MQPHPSWRHPGTAAFATSLQEPEINQSTIDAVATCLSGHTGEHYSPHVIIGVGTVDYLNALLAAPFSTVPASINNKERL